MSETWKQTDLRAQINTRFMPCPCHILYPQLLCNVVLMEWQFPIPVNVAHVHSNHVTAAWTVFNLAVSALTTVRNVGRRELSPLFRLRLQHATGKTWFLLYLRDVNVRLWGMMDFDLWSEFLTRTSTINVFFIYENTILEKLVYAIINMCTWIVLLNILIINYAIHFSRWYSLKIISTAPAHYRLDMNIQILFNSRSWCVLCSFSEVEGCGNRWNPDCNSSGQCTIWLWAIRVQVTYHLS